MTSPLRSGLHVALNRPRVLALVAAVVLVETALRVALGFLHPVASVVFPPVVAVAVLGAALPTVRGLAVGPSSTPDWQLSVRLRERGRRLVAAAVVCHGVALALGVALFLLVDTPARFVFYTVDGGTLPWPFVYAAPLPGVLLGTVLAWGPLATVVARVAAGDSVSTAFETAVGVALGRPRRTATLLGLHLVAVVVVLGAALTGFAFAVQTRLDLVFLIAIGVLVFLTGLLTLGFLYPVHAALANAAPGRATVPVRGVVLAVFVVTAAVAGAGAVRVTEYRPAPELHSLPEESTTPYATALDNTARTSYDVRNVETVDGETRVFRRAVDREDREYLTGSNASGWFTAYSDAGVTYRLSGTNPAFELGEREVDGSTAAAVPAYWMAQGEVGPTGQFALPEAGTGQWAVVDRSEDTVTLELRDDDAVYGALFGHHPENATYETAWIRMRVDTERGVVTGGTARVEMTRQGEPLDFRHRYTVETGDDVTVERPAELNPRRPAEWVWKLFAY